MGVTGVGVLGMAIAVAGGGRVATIAGVLVLVLVGSTAGAIGRLLAQAVKKINKSGKISKEWRLFIRKTPLGYKNKWLIHDNYYRYYHKKQVRSFCKNFCRKGLLTNCKAGFIFKKH
jgi:hypothetical protein